MKSGSEATTSAAATISPHSATATGHSRERRSEAAIAGTSPMSRSSISGNEITLRQSASAAKQKPIDPAEALKITPESANRLARRKRWPRVKGNDGRTRVAMPEEVIGHASVLASFRRGTVHRSERHRLKREIAGSPRVVWRGGLCKSRANTAPRRGASAGPCLPTAQPLRDQLYSGRLRVVLRWIKAKALVPKSAPAIGKADDIGRSHRPGR